MQLDYTTQERETIQEADTQPLNSSSDEDYLEISPRMEEAETTEDLEQIGEVNIKINELHSYAGSEVSIILHGDSRDIHPYQGRSKRSQKGKSV